MQFQKGNVKIASFEVNSEKLNCLGRILMNTTYANVPVPHASIINSTFRLANEFSSKGPVAIPIIIPNTGYKQRVWVEGS